MAQKKPIYMVWLQNKLGHVGLQHVKADNKAEAKKKFRKRFPTSRIISVDKATDFNHSISHVI